jgi:predicted permease
MGKWRRDRDDELKEELNAHLSMAVRDRLDRGEPDAEVAARREMGNLATIAEVTRDMWGWRSLERLAQDLHYAGRLLRRTPAFSIVAIVSLAFGIGATTAIFQVINAVRLRTLPVSRPHELVEITPVSMEGARGNFSSWRESLSNPLWEQVRDRQEVFAGTLAYGSATFNLAPGGEVRPARGLMVSGSFFDVLGIRPERGRVLGPDDDRRGCAPRAVVSHGFWQRELASDPAVVGRTLSLDSHPVEIVGVTPASFFGLEVGRTFDVAIPICAEPAVAGSPGRLDSGTDWWLIVMGRMKPGTTIDQANAQLAALSAGIFKATLAPNYPLVSVPKYLSMTLHALRADRGISYVRELYTSPLWLLLGLASLVLAIACANLANLLLARATARQREIAIRLGLGASRGRIIRQLITESALLSAAGAIAGLVLARVFSDALVGFVETDGDAVMLNLGLDWRIVGFTAGLAALTCVLFGLAPALRGTRIGAGAVMNTTGRRVTTTREGTALRRILVVAQVAVSLVMLFGALLFVQTLRNLDRVDTGFAREGIVMTRVDFRQVAVDAEQRLAYKHTLLERLRAIPGVEAAASTSLAPVSGSAWGNDVTVTGPDGPKVVSTRFNRVSQGYFETFRTPIVEGRDFDGAIDIHSAPPVAIVNQTFADLFGRGRAVGGRFTREATPSQPATEFQVVGVVADAKYLTLREDRAPTAYFPLSQEPQSGRGALFAVRGRLQPAALTSSIVQSFKELDPNIGLSFTVLETQIRQTLVRERLMATLSSFFGSIAALLAVVGLYGVIAYTVTRRTNEIGVRMALGASRGTVVAMVLGEAGVLVGLGIGIGLIFAFLSGRFAETLLFGLEPRDPLSMGLAAAVLAAVAMMASYLPARAAANIEPTAALRVE